MGPAQSIPQAAANSRSHLDRGQSAIYWVSGTHLPFELGKSVGDWGDLWRLWLDTSAIRNSYLSIIRAIIVIPHLRTLRMFKLRLGVKLAMAANVTDTICRFAELYDQVSVL